MDFLRTYQMDPKIASDLIPYFHSRKQEHAAGLVARNGEIVVDKEHKDSTELGVSQNELETHEPIIAWSDALRRAAIKYVEEFSFARGGSGIHPWGIETPINIQHYSPGGGYKTFHTERTGDKDTIFRHLVFMTYLNTIGPEDLGGTEFYYQKRVLQPKAGLTAIWPADWTYCHRGISSPTKDKYIITGWFTFLTD